MNRRFFRILALVAGLAWGYAAWQLWNAWMGGKVVAQKSTTPDLVIVPDSCTRDPFGLTGKPRGKANRVSPSTSKLTAKALDAVVDTTRIAPARPIWGGYIDGSPAMVILKRNERTEIVKVGDSIFGWRVLKLGKDVVQLRCGGLMTAVHP